MTVISVLDGIMQYLKTYTGLVSGAPVWVDFLGQTPTEYGVIPLPGARIVEKYLNGASLREFPFAFNATMATADDTTRLANSDFFETFAAWLESQTLAGTLPTLEVGKTAEAIEAVSWGYLFQQGESGTGVYQIQCRLTYGQAAND